MVKFSSYLNFLSCSFFLICVLATMGFAQTKSYGEQVLRAVAPVYPFVAASVGVEGTVVVEAKINSYGQVILTRIERGDKLLNVAAEKATLRWLFAPRQMEKPERTMSISFHFKLMPDDVLNEEITSTFMPPNQIEVRRKQPKVIDSPNIDPPLRTRKKS